MSIRNFLGFLIVLVVAVAVVLYIYTLMAARPPMPVTPVGTPATSDQPK
jgi:hypothetical protein